MKYRIATRGSQLALVQANYVRKRLMQAYPENEFEILVVKTKGDLVLDRPLDQIEIGRASCRERVSWYV